MRILFLTPQLPYPPHQGTTIRNYHLMRELAARHEVHLLSFSVTPGGARSAAELAREGLPFCAGVTLLPPPARTMRDRALSTLLSPLPDMGLRLASGPFHERLAEVLRRESFDIIQIEGIEMAPYLLQAASLPAPRPRLVFDDHNAEYILQRRAFETDLRHPGRWIGALYSFIQWQKLRRYERHACRAADAVVAVSTADAAALERLVPSLRVAIVPNGVDLAYWQPPAAREAIYPPSLVFTGKMDFRPNVDAVIWFIQEVLPRIRQRLPEVHFYVVGQSPHRRLASLSDDAAITITGYVDDVRPYVAAAGVYVVPLRIGGGTRLKVLEAMAMGKALVSTTLGCEGIGVKDGCEVRLADTPEAFAEQVVTLLQNPAQCRALGLRARQFVQERYDWRALVPLMERVYDATA